MDNCKEKSSKELNQFIYHQSPQFPKLFQTFCKFINKELSPTAEKAFSNKFKNLIPELRTDYKEMREDIINQRWKVEFATYATYFRNQKEIKIDDWINSKDKLKFDNKNYISKSKFPELIGNELFLHCTNDIIDQQTGMSYLDKNSGFTFCSPNGILASNCNNDWLFTLD